MRKGFTLVELLMTIVVIGILASLITAAAMKAVIRAKDAAVLTEIQALEIPLKAFQKDFGAYPPSRIVFAEDGDFSAGNLKEKFALQQRSLEYLRGFWPKAQFRTDGTKPFIPGGWYDWNGNHQIDPPYVIDGFTCLSAFLGGVPVRGEGGSIGLSGFDKNPNNPFTSPDPPPAGKKWPFGDNRAMPYEFRSSRLRDSENGIPMYLDLYGNPYVYFSAYKGFGYDPEDANVKEPDDQGLTDAVRGAFQAKASIAPAGNRLSADRPDVIWSLAPNPYTEERSYPLDVKDIRKRMFFSRNSYQVISAGNDGIWGIGGEKAKSDSDAFPIDPVSLKVWTGQTLSENARSGERDNLFNLR